MIPRYFRLAAVLGIGAALTACDAQSSTPVIHTQPPIPSQGTASQSIPDGASDQSVAYQANVEHNGFVHGKLGAPLKQLWSVSLGGAVGYPVIANGIVVAAAGNQLVALNEKSGKQRWSQGGPSGNSWVGPAYDSGKIFADPQYTPGSSGIGMFAFDQKTGKLVWSSQTPGQYAFSSPPTAAAGSVYTGAAGSGGTVYAFNEKSGALNWTASVENGDSSSPVVTPKGIYVSYACPQTYDLQPNSGNPIWHFSGPCEGGGGSTPALYDGLLFVGDSDQTSGYNGLVLNAKTGSTAGGFNASYTPAFAHNIGFFVDYSTLQAQSIPSLKQVWSVSLGSGVSFTTPPLVVGSIVYVETSANYLVGYDTASGKQKLSMQLPSGGTNRSGIAGLAYADGELFVPNGTYLIAFSGK